MNYITTYHLGHREGMGNDRIASDHHSMKPSEGAEKKKFYAPFSTYGPQNTALAGQRKVRRKKNHSAEKAFGKQGEHRDQIYLARGAMILFLMIMAVFAYLLKQKPNNNSKQAKMHSIIQVDDIITNEKWKGDLPHEVVQKFTKAKSHGERMKYVRNPMQVDLAMQDFFSTGPGAKETISSLSGLPTSLTQNASTKGKDTEHVSFVAIMNDGGKRLLLTTYTEQGCKIDFPAYSRDCSDSWKNILSGKVKEATVRVVLHRDSLYVKSFSNESEWLCYSAKSEDLDEPIYLYLPAKDLNLKNQNILKSAKGFAAPTFCTCIIRPVEDSHLSKQFEIKEILKTSWMID